MPTVKPLNKAATKVVTQVVAKLGPIGPTIDMLYDLREQKRKLDAQVKDIEEQYEALAEKLMEKLEAEGTNNGSGHSASASISHTVVGTIDDWDAFWAWAVKKKYSHLVQRRLSDPAIRELFEKNVQIPGISPFTKKRLNLRVLAD